MSKPSILAISAVILILLAGVAVILRAPSPGSDDFIFTESTGAGDELNAISTSTEVSADIDAYLRSSGSLPNPNDFNDSYSDLNR